MKRLALLLGVILISIVIMVFGYRSFSSHKFSGEVLQQPMKIPPIVLRSDAGPVRLEDFHGKLILLYFGYTSCPDICPTSLANIKMALSGLTPEEAAQVQVVFVSVDPARDTPEALGKYVKLFQDEFIGATGTREEIDLMTSAFGAKYKLNEHDANGNYSVDHTSFTILIDRNGYYILKFPHETTSTKMSEDLRYLIKNEMPISAQILAGPTYTPVVCAVTLIPSHVDGGEWLYQHHCAQCHGADMAGNPAWQTELQDGSHFPPPLNQTGSAWQYSEQDLINIIKEGRNLDKPIHMPAFKSTLANWEVKFIITYMKSKWDINQLNYQHGFMTLTPQATSTPAPAIPSP
ncbi:MAG: SCO family protein [Chloroflexi bacterium]|nr:SCO family protein [Chloroflexota bacterium]